MKEIDHNRIVEIQNHLGNNGKVGRVERPFAKAFLMAGIFLRNGKMLEPKVKHIGLGVYELTVSEWKG